MVRTLLIRGMAVGFLAGLLVFGYARIFGEPQIDNAISFERALDAARDKALDARGIHPIPMPELVSRRVQGGIGLLVAVTSYCTAFGGLFALVFACANGRAAETAPRPLSAWLALAGFIAVSVVPDLKYPANPPSIGNPDTIGQRTALYFAMIALSLAAMAGAAIFRKRLLVRWDEWTATLIASAAYIVLMILAQELLPSIDEVPNDFPAIVLWRFRVTALGMQCIMWAAIGLAFGALTGRDGGTNGHGIRGSNRRYPAWR